MATLIAPHLHLHITNISMYIAICSGNKLAITCCTYAFTSLLSRHDYYVATTTFPSPTRRRNTFNSAGIATVFKCKNLRNKQPKRTNAAASIAVGLAKRST